MNPVKLIFKHGGEMLVSPIGLRFVEDPDHGPLVLIPELSQPKAYALAMTLAEASEAFCDAVRMSPMTNFAAVKLEEFEKKLELLGRKIHADGDHFENTKAGWELHEERLDSQREATHLLERRIREFGDRLTEAVLEHRERLELLLKYLGIEPGWIGRIGTMLRPFLPALETYTDNVAARVDALKAKVSMHGDHLNNLSEAVIRQGERQNKHELRADGHLLAMQDINRRLDRNCERWGALAIHLGLPEDWEHLHEGAAEVKGALVSQAEAIDALKREVASNWTLGSNLRTELRDLLLERIKRLEQGMIDRVGGLERLTGCLCTYRMVERKACEIDSVKASADRLRDDYNKLDYSLVDLARWCGSLEQRIPSADHVKPFEPEDRNISFPQIAWSNEHKSPIDIVTGEVFGPTGWEAPEEPKKSAWKPAAECDKAGWWLLRIRGYDYTARPCYYRSTWERRDLEKAGFKNGIHGLEFCPIPE